MTYFEAESMRQEMIVAIKFRELAPDGPRETAKNYTADQWMECYKVILEKMENDKSTLYELMDLILKIRKVR
jgi:hypothetical protein